MKIIKVKKYPSGRYSPRVFFVIEQYRDYLIDSKVP